MNKHKVGKHRNRDAGHGYERDVVGEYHKAGYVHVITTRSGSRYRDSQGIDLMNKDESENGRLEYNPQCKNQVPRVDYHTLLKGMPSIPGIINVVHHKYTGRSNSVKAKGTVFILRGKYAVLTEADFFKMVTELVELRKIKQQFLDTARRGDLSDGPSY